MRVPGKAVFWGRIPSYSLRKKKTLIKVWEYRGFSGNWSWGALGKMKKFQSVGRNMFCHHPSEIHSSLFFSLLYTPGIWLLWTPSPFWSTFVWLWTKGGTVRPHGTFGPFLNFQQTFGPCQKVPEIWSLPKFPWAYLVHVKWFWTGPNIKDILLWTKCSMDVLDRTKWSCDYQGHFGMDHVSYEWHVLCIKCLMDILDRPKRLLTLLGDWMVGGKRKG